jgi:chromosome segregation ATPase
MKKIMIFLSLLPWILLLVGGFMGWMYYRETAHYQTVYDEAVRQEKRLQSALVKAKRAVKEHETEIAALKRRMEALVGRLEQTENEMDRLTMENHALQKELNRYTEGVRKMYD